MDFCKNPTFTCIFWDFLETSIFFPEFFWIFDIRIGKINLFPRFFLDFCKNPSFSLGFLFFLKNPSFSLSFFGFLTWKPKNPNTLSKNPKKSKKRPRKSKNPSLWPESKDSVWKDGFLDFWIFGWTILRNPRLHLFDLNPSILVERWVVGFLFPFFGRISALSKKNKPRMIATQLWLEGTGIMHFICVFPWFFHHFILHWYVYIYIYMLVPLRPYKM